MSQVMVIADVNGWAQSRAAHGIAKYAPPGIKADVRILHGHGTAGIERYDAAYFLDFASAPHKDKPTRIVASIGSHAWIHKAHDPDDWRTNGTNRQRCRRIGSEKARRLDGVVCRSSEILRWASGVNPMAVRIPAGIDLDIWQPGPFRGGRTRPVVGWCAQIGGPTSFKGYKEILAPLQRMMRSVEWRVLTHDYTGAISTERMVEFYQGLDVFISTSSADGTPNPPFEAAACGVPVVSTDVGAVSDWGALRALGLIVPAYHNEETAAVTRAAIRAKIRRLNGKPNLRLEIRERLRASIESEYDYRILAPQILEYVCHV